MLGGASATVRCTERVDATPGRAQRVVVGRASSFSAADVLGNVPGRLEWRATEDGHKVRAAIHFRPNATYVGAGPVKKGRHRRFEEARALKRSTDLDISGIFALSDGEPCAECGAEPGEDHASWCMADVIDDEE